MREEIELNEILMGVSVDDEVEAANYSRFSGDTVIVLH